jgi:hypothetical protein
MQDTLKHIFLFSLFLYIVSKFLENCWYYVLKLLNSTENIKLNNVKYIYLKVHKLLMLGGRQPNCYWTLM